MKFLAFDLETTGLDPNTCQVLEIGAVAFDLKGNHHSFSTLVRHEEYRGEPYALQMNATILKELANGKGMAKWEAWASLRDWMTELGLKKPHPVGFNVGSFDMQFVPQHHRKLFHHRCIELGSLLLRQDGAPMTSNQATATYLGGKVSHRALDDARDARAIFLKKVWR